MHLINHDLTSTRMRKSLAHPEINFKNLVPVPVDKLLYIYV